MTSSFLIVKLQHRIYILRSILCANLAKKCGAIHIVCSMIVTVNVFAAAVLVRERLRFFWGDIVLKRGVLY